MGWQAAYVSWKRRRREMERGVVFYSEQVARPERKERTGETAYEFLIEDG